MIPPKKPIKEDNVDSWLMSYADMITLLLCFFLVFVSVSEPKREKLAAITEGMTQRFGLVDLTTPYQGLMHSLQTITENHHVLKDVAVVMTSNGIEIELAAGTFYKNGSADFMQDKMPVLLNIVDTIKSVDYLDFHVTVEGHTSDVQTSSAQYPSNWELSSARAVKLVRLLIAHGISPDHLRAIGYGDSMPKVPNLDQSGKPIPENRAKNERIVVKIERTK